MLSETTDPVPVPGEGSAPGEAAATGLEHSPRLCGTFGVGAGIVADSNPDREWRETVAKSRGIVD